MVRTPPTSGRLRQRDLFPLPGESLLVATGDVFHLSRSVQRRVKKKGHVGVLAKDVCDGLNWLDGSSSSFSQPTSTASLGQQLVLDDVVSRVREFPPCPVGLHPTGAFSELRGASMYDDPGARVANFDFAALSLPPAGCLPKDLATVYGEGGAEVVIELCTKHLLEKGAAEVNLKDAGVKTAYVDPVLGRNPRSYARYLRRLHGSGMVEWRLEAPKGTCGVFFVKKNTGALRSVIDARRSNCWFSPPSDVRLASGSSLAEIDGCGSEFFCGGVDLKEAFWHFELPPCLRCYFWASIHSSWCHWCWFCQRSSNSAFTD